MKYSAINSAQFDCLNFGDFNNNNNNKNTFIKRIMKRPQSAVQEVLKLQKQTFDYSKQSWKYKKLKTTIN